MDSVGGFRLVRRLGSGMRAEVHLGHSTGGADAGARTAAIKVYRPTTSRASVDREVDALARCSSRFLLRLDDLAMARDDMPVLILNRIGSMSLSTWCLEREQITHGEAVTVIAPLAEAVEELQRVGVAHGNIRLSTVYFDDGGAPVLIGFGSARIVGEMPAAATEHSLSPAQVEATPGLIKDLKDLRSLARTVLDCTPASTARSALTEWLSASDLDLMRFSEELRERLFELAAPTPVDLRPANDRVTTAHPGRPVDSQLDDTSDTVAVPQWLAVLHLPRWLEDLVPDGRFELIARTRAALSAVRRPVWIIAGAVTALLVIATVFVGLSDQVSADAAPESAGSGTAVHPSDDVRPSPRASVIEPVASDSRADGASALTGEDPVAAVSTLLRIRAACFTQKSALCLDGVDHPSSAAMEADVYSIVRAGDARASPAGPDLTISTPVLVEHLGGSAILRLEFPDGPPGEVPLRVSVLVVKGQSGWRIRDLMTG